MHPSLEELSSGRQLERVIGGLLRAGKIQVLSLVAGLTGAIALADWYVGNRASLGVFYILPMVLGATVLTRFQTVLLAIVCSGLRSWFDIPTPRVEVLLRFIFACLAYAVSGLFVTALIENKKLVMEHLSRIRLEQDLRRDAEQQLKVLVESSPAAVLTVDGVGVVLAANSAAGSLFMIPEGETLKGRRIGRYLPVLADALQFARPAEGLRTAAQCQGRRENGEVFLAHTWFSSYTADEGTQLAAIVVDSSEEMRAREQQNLEQLLQGNRIAAAAVSHEVRNLCTAISVVCSDLEEKHQLFRDEDFQQLAKLVSGLQRVASIELQSRALQRLEEVRLQEVLDDLRIVIEPDWRDIDGKVRCKLPATMPTVLGERHGLLQVFLNLAQNSYRAVQDCPVRELTIEVAVEELTARLQFWDTGPGVTAPERLFTPFQAGSEGTGLGSYISRSVVRSYGGELRFDPKANGTCFTVEAQVV